jgi:GAF domain-containing protein
VEARQQQTATTDLLRIISSSGSLERVFETILENATRICEANFGTLYLAGGDRFQRTAHYNTPPAYLELVSCEPVYRPGPKSVFARVAATKQFVHITDLAAEEHYGERDSVRVAAVEVLGIRTLVVVPMLRENELVSVIAIFHQEVHPFTEKQIQPLQNFAAQAVIAIENARLLNELRQRTADLSESLERQTATADVLRIISSSPGELKPVFDMILDNAVKLCEASMGDVFRVEGNLAHIVGTMGALPEYAAFRRDQRPYAPAPNTPLGDAIRSREPVHVTDMRELPGYAARMPNITASIELNRVRTQLVVPMVRDDDVIGVIMIFRREVRPFEQTHVELVKNFATQAVIAIENARLLNKCASGRKRSSSSTSNSNSALLIKSARSSAWAGCDAFCRRKLPI